MGCLVVERTPTAVAQQPAQLSDRRGIHFVRPLQKVGDRHKLGARQRDALLKQALVAAAKRVAAGRSGCRTADPA